MSNSFFERRSRWGDAELAVSINDNRVTGDRNTRDAVDKGSCLDASADSDCVGLAPNSKAANDDIAVAVGVGASTCA